MAHPGAAGNIHGQNFQVMNHGESVEILPGEPERCQTSPDINSFLNHGECQFCLSQFCSVWNPEFIYSWENPLTWYPLVQDYE